MADFVAGVSRLGVVTTARIMQPIENGIDLSTVTRVAPGATLGALVDIACDTDSPIVVANDVEPLGWISKRNLLKGIQGGATGGLAVDA